MEIKQKIYRMVRGQKQACGLIVSSVDYTEKKVYIGFSLCKKTDKYDKDLALQIATGRAIKKDQVIVPQSIVSDMDYFVSRVARYYKDLELGSDIIEASKFNPNKYDQWDKN